MNTDCITFIFNIYNRLASIYVTTDDYLSLANNDIMITSCLSLITFTVCVNLD